jgi:hypothetical protein
VDKLEAWNRVANKPDSVTRGSEAWEDKDGDPTDGTLRYTNEGPTVTKVLLILYLKLNYNFREMETII